MHQIYLDLPKKIHGLIQSKASSWITRNSFLVMIGIPCFIAEAVGGFLHFSGSFLIDDYLLQKETLQGVPIYIFVPAEALYIIINIYYLLPVYKLWRLEKKKLEIPSDLLFSSQSRVYNYPIFLIISTYFVWAAGAIPYIIIFYSRMIVPDLAGGLMSTVLNAILVYYMAELLNRFFFIPYYFADGKVNPKYVLLRKPSLFQRFWDLYLVNGVFPATAVLGVIFITLQYGSHDADELSRLLIASTIIAVVFLGFGFILTSLTSLTFTLPLNSLAKAASDLANEDFQSRVIVQSDDQLGKLQMMMNKMGQVLQEKNTMKTLFGHYVSPVVRDLILEGKINTRGDRVEAVILFSDIRSFTALSEKYKPELVVEILNVHFSRIVNAVSDNQGFIDKFIGDAVMAVFDAELCSNNHREFALNAAMQILDGMVATNQKLAELNIEPLRIGVGMCCGPVIRGNIGSENRKELTVIGDTVNTASRLESLTKERGVPLIASKNSIHAELVQLPNYEVIDMEPANLRGKLEAVEIIGLRKR